LLTLLRTADNEINIYNIVAGCLWLMPVILATWEAEIRPAQANSLKDPISKITRAKWTEGVVQEVECLLCKPQSHPPPKKTRKHLHYSVKKKNLV
jgi:hypothetical protein